MARVRQIILQYFSCYWQVLEQSALYNDKRRRKLEEMRMRLKDEGGGDSPIECLQTAGRNSPQFGFKPISNDSKGGDSTSLCQSFTEIRDNLVNNEIEKSLHVPLESMQHVQQHQYASSTVSSQRGQSSSIHSGEVDEVRLSKEGDSSHAAMRENESETRMARDRLSAVEPDLIQSVKSSSLGRNSSVPDMRTENRLRRGGSELSPEDWRYKEQEDKMAMPPPPVVPPRRKKKAVSMGSLNQEQVTKTMAKF